MLSIVSLLVVVVLSMLVTRIAAVALTHTGLSQEAARFQARSAFTGVGFTTTESESVVNHPVRRRIVLLLMLLGNAGIITGVSTLILGFVDEGEGDTDTLVKVVLLVGGLVVLWAVASSALVQRGLSRLIDKGLKRYARIEARDYASLLHLGGDYRIAELKIEPEDWLAGRRLRETNLRHEGIVVLGIEVAGGEFLGAPDGDTIMEPGTTALLYGRTAAIQRLDQRRRDYRGEVDHRAAVEEQERVKEAEQAQQAAPKRSS